MICFAFSHVSGPTIEVNQKNHLWRTDAKANPNFKLKSEYGTGDSFDCNSETVAVGLSVTGPIEADVREYIAKLGDIKGVISSAT